MNNQKRHKCLSAKFCSEQVCVKCFSSRYSLNYEKGNGMLAYNLMDRTATNGLNHLWLRMLLRQSLVIEFQLFILST